MKQVKEFLHSCLGISDDELISKVATVATIRTIPKGEHWAHCGDDLPGVAFLISGMFRFYFLDSEGREHVDCFCGEAGHPVIPAIDFNMPLPINVQALEESTVLVIPTKLVQSLMEDNIEAVRLYNQLLIRSLTIHWEDKMALHQYDAAQRYEWFLERYKGLIDRIPHVHIASFLNITSVTLSRLRNKKLQTQSSE